MLLVLEHMNGRLDLRSKCTIGFALALQQIVGSDCTAFCIGSGAKIAGLEAQHLGVSQAFYNENPVLDRLGACDIAKLACQVFKQIDASTILAPASSLADDFAPQVACSLNAGYLSNVIGIEDNGSFRRLMYSGRIEGSFKIGSTIKVLTVAPTAFSEPAAYRESGALREFSIDLSAISTKQDVEPVTHCEVGPAHSLFDAKVVVAGGRGLRSPEHFKELVVGLAELVGAAVGASRGAVDFGIAPSSAQVGLTGAQIAPEVYIAIGISGSSQHLCGMRHSRNIIVINNDPDAPLIDFAQYALIGDLFEVVPELIASIKKKKTR